VTKNNGIAHAIVVPDKVYYNFSTAGGRGENHTQYTENLKYLHTGILYPVVLLFTLSVVCGQTKHPRGGFKKRKKPSARDAKRKVPRKAPSPEPEENLCLLRATNGKKKLSTVVSAKEVTRFQLVRNSCMDEE